MFATPALEDDDYIFSEKYIIYQVHKSIMYIVHCIFRSQVYSRVQHIQNYCYFTELNGVLRKEI